MIRAYFTVLNTERDYVYQYDTNQVLNVVMENLKTAPKIEFCNKKSKGTISKQAILNKNGFSCDVPNTLLAEPYPILGYINLGTDKMRQIFDIIQIPMVTRVMPEGYEIPIDLPKIVVSVDNLNVNEDGFATFDVCLNMDPGKSVTISLSASNGITFNRDTINFNSKNYSDNQTITVTAPDDDYIGNYNTIIDLTSPDLIGAQIALTVINNDVIEYVTADKSDLAYVSGTYKIVQKYTGSGENVEIPAAIDGVTVKVDTTVDFDPNSVIRNLRFQDGALMNNFVITSTALKTIVNIPESANSITITNGEMVTMPDFSKCTNLTTLRIQDCTKLVNVTSLANTVITSLEQGFKGCTALVDARNLELPETLLNTKLMFWNCSNLEKGPTVKHNITNVVNMFYACPKLKEITIENNDCGDMSIIGYEGTWSNGDLTFKCNFNSAMYRSFRNMICDSAKSCEKFFIELLDGREIIDVVMWGDSMTRAGNNTMSNMPDQLAEMVSNDVMIWNYGYSGNTIQTCATRFDNHSEKHDKVSVIWLGTNNTALSGEEMTALIQSSFIDKLTTDKYIVVGLLTTNYSDEKNQAFINAFGDHFLNIREYFLEKMWTISGLSATDQDNTDLAGGLIPTSFRVDQTHLNPTGGLVVATAIKEKLISMGYISE